MKLHLLVLALLLAGEVFAQNVGINANSAAPNSSALLDIDGSALPANNQRGLLIPRIALVAANVASPVVSPAVSLLVYNTATAGIAPNDVIPGFHYWDGTRWVRLLVNTSPPVMQTCPTGMTDFGTFCIEDNLHSVANLNTAVTTCQNMTPHMRLCNWSEWSPACLSGLISSLGDNWEWVGEEPDGTNGKIFGGGSCALNGTTPIGDDRFFRCCLPKNQ